jgi:SAM-dependent methyltransferase
VTDASFTAVYSQALQGNDCHVVGLEDAPVRLPVDAWTREADQADQALLDLCRGPTLDIGCGPGRLTIALAARGEVVLGIDIVHEAVGQTRLRGGAAQLCDVFFETPGEGEWGTALLADGNIGIGGDPVMLLTRVRELLGPGGRVVVELKAPGVALQKMWATLQCGDATSRPFRWAVVGVDDIDEVAACAGLVVTARGPVGPRWATVLEEPQ